MILAIGLPVGRLLVEVRKIQEIVVLHRGVHRGLSDILDVPGTSYFFSAVYLLALPELIHQLLLAVHLLSHVVLKECRPLLPMILLVHVLLAISITFQVLFHVLVRPALQAEGHEVSCLLLLRLSRILRIIVGVCEGENVHLDRIGRDLVWRRGCRRLIKIIVHVLVQYVVVCVHEYRRGKRLGVPTYHLLARRSVLLVV